MKAWNHFITVTQHRMMVMKHCFKVGLYKQGLTHDLSKYSLSEFLVGVRYYQGNRSPNNAEREILGYSSAWLHHKGRNKHHYEYWIDYSLKKGEGMVPVRMPVKYVIEMFCDRVAACKIYQKEKYTDRSPLEYYVQGKSRHMIHPETDALLEKLLRMLSEKGEEETFLYIRHKYVKPKNKIRKNNRENF